MPDKEYLIQELKQRIENLKKYYEEMENLNSSVIMLGIIASKIFELEERLEKLEQNPRDLELEVYEELCVRCSDEKICHEECEHCVQFYERLEELEEEENEELLYE